MNNLVLICIFIYLFSIVHQIYFFSYYSCQAWVVPNVVHQPIEVITIGLSRRHLEHGVVQLFGSVQIGTHPTPTPLIYSKNPNR